MIYGIFTKYLPIGKYVYISSLEKEMATHFSILA